MPLFIWWNDKFSPYISAFSIILPDWNNTIKDWSYSCRNQYNKNINLFRLHNFPVQIYNFNKSAGLIYSLKADIVCSCWCFLTHYYGFHTLLYPWCFPNTTSKCGKKGETWMKWVMFPWRWHQHRSMTTPWLRGVFLDTRVGESPITDRCDVKKSTPPCVPTSQKAITLLTSRLRQSTSTLLQLLFVDRLTRMKKNAAEFQTLP